MSCEEREISFFLLNVYYEPEDCKFYLEGRSEEGSVSVQTEFECYFYLERRERFVSKEDALGFFYDLQCQLDSLDEFTVENPHSCDPYAPRKETVVLKGKGGRYTRQGEVLREFWTRIELIENRHKHMAHYTLDDDYVQVVKVWVRRPEAMKSIMKYFYSNEFFDRHGESAYVRTYGCTADPPALLARDTNAKRASWCTVKGREPVASFSHRKVNLVADVKDLGCEKERKEMPTLRVFSFDGEMTSGKDPETGRSKFCDAREDPIYMMGALIYDWVDGAECSLVEGKVFVNACPDAPATTSLADWKKRKVGEDVRLKRMWEEWGYDKIEVVDCASEKALLEAFQAYLRDSDCDVLSGWNIMRFDIPYVVDRCEIVGANPVERNGKTMGSFNFGSKIGGARRVDVPRDRDGGNGKKGGASTKTGVNYRNVKVSSCRVHVSDGYQYWVDNQQKKKPYSLENAARCSLEHASDVVKGVSDFLSELDADETELNALRVEARTLNALLNSEFGLIDRMTRLSLKDGGAGSGGNLAMKKISFDHENAMRLWKSGADDALFCAMYCALDCMLPPKIAAQLNVWSGVISVAGVCNLNVNEIVERGQQCRVNMQIRQTCLQEYGHLFLDHDKGYRHFFWPGVWELMPKLGLYNAVMKFWTELAPITGKAIAGGHVQEPSRLGLMELVATLDFTSMYPNIMLWYNLCTTTFLTSWLIDRLRLPRYAYSRHVLGGCDKNKCGELVNDPESALKVGEESPNVKLSFFGRRERTLLPKMVQNLTAERNRGKAFMAIWRSLMYAAQDAAKERCDANVDVCAVAEEHCAGEEASARRNAMEKWLKKKMEVSQKAADQKSLSLALHNLALACYAKDNGGDKMNFAVTEDSASVGALNGKESLFFSVMTRYVAIASKTPSLRQVASACKSMCGVWNQYQLAVKVSMNSMYGVQVNGVGFFLVVLAATVTSIGRNLIMKVKNYVNNQTIQDIKKTMGMEGASTKKGARGTAAPPVPVGRVARKLPPGFVRTMRPHAAAPSAVSQVYGDTDSIMTMYKRDVANVEQFFEVMFYLSDFVNKNMGNGMNMAAEKGAWFMLMFGKKNYYMLIREVVDMKKDKHKFAGNDKGDTVPYVTKIQQTGTKALVDTMQKGHSREVAIAKTVHVVREMLNEFASGRVPPYFLSTTKGLKKFDPRAETANTQHAQVALKIIRRGGSVYQGDVVTYLWATNLKTGAVELESLEEVVREGSEWTPNLEKIWETGMRNKILSYFKHVLAPLLDLRIISSHVTADLKAFQLEAKKQTRLQEERVAQILTEQPGGLVRRFQKRKALHVNAAGKQSDALVRFAGGGKTRECGICGGFFLPESLEIEFETARNSMSVCSSCEGEKERLKKQLAEKHRKNTSAFLSLRATCLTCIALPLSPDDSKNPKTPEKCTNRICATYKEKFATLAEIETCEKLLGGLGADHCSW